MMTRRQAEQLQTNDHDAWVIARVMSMVMVMVAMMIVLIVSTATQKESHLLSLPPFTTTFHDQASPPQLALSPAIMFFVL